DTTHTQYNYPPFPTRRSSDLQKSGSDRKAYQWNKWISKTDSVQVHLLRRCKDLPNFQVGALQLLQRFFGIDLRRIRIGAADSRRSEEHRSELQSRVDLVCRLL